MTTGILLFAIACIFEFTYLIIVLLAVDTPFKGIDKTEGESYMDHDVMEPIHYKKAA